jgi:hypothetical protein
MKNNTPSLEEWRKLMRRFAIAALGIASVALTFASTALAVEQPARRPADRVVAMYFHRTERCPTCLKMGSYSEEAIKKGLEKQVREGSVEFHYVDFQNKKNAALTKGYKISGPALVVAKVEANKVKEFKDLKDIWTKVQEKPKFLTYVRENVEAYLKKPRAVTDSP